MRRDPLTKEEFEPKRTNQRFANPENRINYHNEIAREKRKLTSKVNYTLTRNWNIILKQLDGKRKVMRSYEFMLGAGFDFDYFQRQYHINDSVFCRIYNCIYLINDDDMVRLGKVD